MKKPIVFIGSSVHPWNDPRVLYKEAVSLAKEYEVELHITAPFNYKEVDGVKIFGLPQWKAKADRRRSNWQLLKHVFASDARVFHFHDPELLPLAILTKVFKNAKVVFDFHEQLENKIVKRDWIPVFLRNPLVWSYKFLGRLTIEIIDGSIGVIEDQVPTLQKTEQYVIVKNYPILHDTKDSADAGGEIIHLGYIGAIAQERRIKEIIEVCRELNNQFSLQLHIIGEIKHTNYKMEMEQLVQRYNMQDNVRFYGYLSIDEAMKIVQKWDIGFLPLRKKKHFVRSLPVKLFDYMSAGLAIVMPAYPLSKDIILKSNSGVIVDTGNLQDIVAKVKYLLENPNIRREMGENGRKYAKKYFSWYTQEQKLLSFYKKL